MKKIIISLTMIAAVAALAVGATGAFFSDTDTSEGNTIAAGTLDLKVNGYDDPVPALFQIGDLKPSIVQYTDPIRLHIFNNPGKLYKHIVAAECDTGMVSEPECTDQGGVWNTEEGCDWGEQDDDNDLPRDTWFDLSIDEETIISDNVVKLGDIISHWIFLGEYPASEDIEIIQSFHLDEGVTNWAQGDACDLTEEFMVLQTNAPHPDDLYNAPGENSGVECSNGIDDDFDNLIDADDPSCLD